MRPARISATAPGTSVKGGSIVRAELGMLTTPILAYSSNKHQNKPTSYTNPFPRQQKRRPKAAFLKIVN
jgi:hypothetical protein